MPPRMKSKAAPHPVPQSREETAGEIRRLGELSREYERLQSLMNDQIAKVTEIYAPQMARVADAMKATQQAVQTWCEAHRTDLCGENDRLGKTAKLITGEVGWRMRPPSVRVVSAEDVIERLRSAGLGRFVRVKEEVNKDAVLAEPDSVREIAGLTVTRGLEDFFVVPFEVRTDAQALASAGTVEGGAR